MSGPIMRHVGWSVDNLDDPGSSFGTFPTRARAEYAAERLRAFGCNVGVSDVEVPDELAAARASLAAVRAAVAAAKERADDAVGHHERTWSCGMREVCRAVEDALDGETT